MNKDQLFVSTKNDYQTGDGEFKIIEVNITDPSESLFSVVTPIKNQ